MKNRARLIVLAIILLFAFPLNYSWAWKYRSITPPAKGIYGPIEPRTLQLSNGYFVYVLGKHSASNNLHIWLYGNDGELLAYTIASVSFGGDDHYINALSLYDDSGHNRVVIFGAGGRVLGGNPAVSVFAGYFSYPAYTYTSAGVIPISTSVAGHVEYISKSYYYNNYAYAILTLYTGGSTPGHTGILKYNIASPAVTWTESSPLKLFDGPIDGFQNPNDTKSVYIFSAKYGESSRPVYYKADLSALTVAVLAENPTNTHWRINTYISARYIGGGVVYDADTLQYVLYHTWAWTDDYSDIEIAQDQLTFNSPVLTSGSLTGQYFRNGILGLIYTMGVSHELSVIGGYCENASKFTLYHINQEAGAYYCNKHNFVVSDWYDYGGGSIGLGEGGSTGLVSNSAVVRSAELAYSDVAYKAANDSFQICEFYDKTFIYVYSGLIPYSATYSLTTSHNPTGDMYTSTQYEFTGILRLNGALRGGAMVTIKADNGTLTTKTTESNGAFHFLFLSTIAGFHQLTYEIYDNGEYMTSKTENLILISLTGEDTGAGFMPTMFSTIFNLLPIMLVLFIPAFALMAVLGTTGFLMGLVIGAVAGGAAGIVPTGAFLLIALLVALYMVFGRRGGGM